MSRLRAGRAALLQNRRRLPNQFIPSTLAVGAQFHAVWDRTGSAFGTIHTDIIEKFAAAGIRYCRIDVSWAGFEPTQGSFVGRPATNGKLEDTLSALQARGMKALITLNEAPLWSHPSYTESTKCLPDDPNFYTGIGKWFTEYLAPWNSALLGVELFNEANLVGSGGFDRGVSTPRPAHYADCLIAYYNAAKASTNPSLPVVYGAPESISVDPSITSDIDAGAKTNYIGLTYDHLNANRGGVRPWDVMAVHVYPAANRYAVTPDYVSFFSHMPALFNRMQAEGDNSPVYITESGHSAFENVTGETQPWNTGVTEQQQADFTIEDIQSVRRDWPRIKLFIVYNDWEKGDPATTTPEGNLNLQNTRNQYGFGILEYADRGTTKPIYSAMKTELL